MLRRLAIVFFVLLASVSSRAEPPNTDLDSCESLIAQGARLLAERPSVDVSEFDHEGLPRTDNARGHHEMTRKARALWKRASTVCLDVAEKTDDPDTTLRGLARGYWIQGQWHAAEKRRGVAIEAYEAGIARGESFAAEKGLDRRHLVPLYEALADLVWRERGDFAEAHGWVDRALEARREAYGSAAPEVVPGLTLKAAYLSSDGTPEEREAMGTDLAEAKRLFEEAVRILRESDASPELIRETFASYGGWLIRQGRIEESRELRDLEQALRRDASSEP